MTTFAGAADGAKPKYPFVFVSGYAGWGQYSGINETYQYWGMSSGDLLGYLNSRGFACYAASVDPVGSAWDRACELYAQMTGTVVDYGRVHSALYKHSRYGTDYTGRALIPAWSETDKVNFVGHSFGGATVRLLSQLLAYGSPQEVTGTTEGEVSGLFTGGKTGWINSITTMASPHNGTTMTNLSKPVAFLLPKDGEKIVGVTDESSIAIINYLITLEAETLVIGHPRDPIHPAADAAMLADSLASARPRLLRCGGAKRLLVMMPNGSTSAEPLKILYEQLNETPSVAQNHDGDFILCYEVEQISLTQVAVSIIDGRRDYAEFAGRFHTRTDVEWSTLPDIA